MIYSLGIGLFFIASALILTTGLPRVDQNTRKKLIKLCFFFLGLLGTSVVLRIYLKSSIHILLPILFGIRIIYLVVLFRLSVWALPYFGGGIFIVCAGAFSNALAVGLNNYQMPVDYSLATTPFKESIGHTFLTDQARLAFLADIWTIDGTAIFSIGDIMIFIGTLMMIAYVVFVKLKAYFAASR